MKRFLGIDYGAKKVGLALSDEGGRLAFPKAVWPNLPGLAERISALCAEENVSRIVLGQSLSSSGAENPIQAEIAKFKAELEKKAGLPAVWEPEIFTTAEARRYQAELKDDDASAAAIILQRFLDNPVRNKISNGV